MIQLYQNIKKNAANINKELGEFGQIQKIYSSAYMLEFNIRSSGKTHHLFIGRGELFQGLHLSNEALPQKLRQKDKLLELLRAKLVSRSFLGILIDSKDRAFAIKYMQARRENYFLFFYQGKRLYIASVYYDFDKENFFLLKSWSQEKRIIVPNDENIFFVFDEVGRKELEDKESMSSFSDPITKEYERCEKTDNKKKKFLKRKIKNIKDDLSRNEKVKDLLKIVNDIPYIEALPSKTLLAGFKFSFNSINAYQRRDEIYQKIKKINKGSQILTTRLEETLKQAKALEDEKLILPKIVTPVWNEFKKEEINTTEKNDHEFIVYRFEDFALGMGKSAKGNDDLRKLWAKKTDYWFHLEHGTSPHIILKGDNLILDEKILSIIAGVFESSLQTNNRTLDLIYTQVKNIKGVKGTSGKVIYKKEKHQRIIINAKWKTMLIPTSR